ncbi:hypothetical protein DFS33DRAFT_1273474 [Desarmillaria ectypa]|nr:hypothetical protein DFS33DRAFT_1273474 [Desarmillaria ectypa]
MTILRISKWFHLQFANDARYTSNVILVAFFRKNDFRRSEFLGLLSQSKPRVSSYSARELCRIFGIRVLRWKPLCLIRGPDGIDDEHQKKYPLRYAIVDQNAFDITTIIKYFYGKDPATFIAAHAKNIHALNKLTAEDLNNTDNIEGITSLEGPGVMDSIHLANSEGLNSAYGRVILRWPFQAGLYMGAPPVDLSSYTRGQSLISFKKMIGCRTLKDIHHDAVFESSTSFYFYKGGKVEYALDAVMAVAKEQSMLGDGTFYETYGEDEEFLRFPECTNDDR